MIMLKIIVLQEMIIKFIHVNVLSERYKIKDLYKFILLV